ncbi:MAG: flagellar basal body L-ring protein FlgH [Deltaproteobacteria bacterium]|nr:MAG: flagellar basal body L-ring protein FlgH [Deltaproteobacteria bacterium]
MKPAPTLLRLLLLCQLLGAAGCVRHVYPYTKKTRKYSKDSYASADAARTPGSLWSEASRNLFEDPRSSRVGDIITITMNEQVNAARNTSTQMQHDSSTNLGIPSFWSAMGALAATNPSIDPNAILAAATNNAFTGQGATSSSGTLSAILPVRIKEAMPNGDFYVEGHKVVLLNDEEAFLYVSGVVRPIDIMPDNTVDSGLLADVEIEYTGRGVLSEAERVPWMQRVINWVWPF